MISSATRRERPQLEIMNGIIQTSIRKVSAQAIVGKQCIGR